MRTALYCRLSKDDEQIGESSSIATQRLMLEQFCNDNNLPIVDYYIDDGFSGLNFDRPDFLRLLDDIEERKIDLVITKDLSRLGRDYIMTGYFTDIYFPKKSVRYIAINDGIDTKTDSNDIAPFKNIMNDMYAKDISRKIKTAKRQRAYQGMHISSQAPYGYIKDPINANKLVPDEAVAPIVRKIFSLALEERTLSSIADTLTKQKIPIPSVHKAKAGDTRYAAYLEKSAEEQVRWKGITIDKILRNPVYLGHMVNHKCEVISYKTKEKKNVPRKDWIIVQNRHEPLIDLETFEKVQAILQKRFRVRRHEFDNWLQGKVFCESCKRPMSLQIKEHKNTKTVIFRCIHSYKHPEECTGYRSFPYDKLFQMVSDHLSYALPDGECLPSPLTKAYVQRNIEAIYISMRKPDGRQDVQIERTSALNSKRKKDRFSWFPGYK